MISLLRDKYKSYCDRLKGQKERFRTFFVPRIGILGQYAPKKLIIPDWYTDDIQLDSFPVISIVTPSYNTVQYMQRTIESVLGQEYPQLQYVIQDGASTDGTAEIIENYEKQLTYWESNPDKGQSHAINKGFKHTTGELMAYLNSDDILLPGTLHYVAQFFLEHPEVDAIYGHRVLINENDDEIGRWVLPGHDNDILTCNDFVPQETLFWRRSLWEKAGGCIDEDFQFAMDWDLLLRFREAGATFERLPRFLGAFRVHSTMKSIVDWNDIGLVEMDRLRKRCYGEVLPVKEMEKITQKYIRKHFFFNKLYRLGLLKY